MKKSVFISRNLAPDSTFLKAVEAAGFTVTGKSLLEFRPIPFVSFPATDWLFFYSRKAVEFFFSQTDALPEKLKISAYGMGTARALERVGYVPHFIGTGEGASTLKAFLKIAKYQSVLFPQARRSRRTIETLAGDQLVCFPLVVYDNFIAENIERSTANFLVFTSPLNVQAYFNNFSLAEKQKIIVIGKTTAAALQAYGIVDFKIAKIPSEAGLAAAVLGDDGLDL